MSEADGPRMDGGRPNDDQRSKGPAVPEPDGPPAPDRTEAGPADGGIPEPVDTAPTPDTDLGRQRPCPRCGSHSVAAIFYGYPAQSVWQDPALGTEFVLGGCCVDPVMPRLHCHNCGHEWT
jgi:hypothetical protein